MSVTQAFLALYDAKIAEYLLSVAYLAVFFPAMWDYVQGAPEPLPKTAAKSALEGLKNYFAVHAHHHA